jgi:putative hydrolase of the HAD superfamily
VSAVASRPPIRRDDIGHIDAWVFDLDNTLYAASTNLFHQIDVRMKAFIADLLGISAEEAFDLQKRYYRQHGTTLRGLMIHHGIAPDAFIDYVHDIDHTVLDPDPELAAALRALPGQKFIYTNGSTHHAASVIARLGVADAFIDIFDIRAGQYIPKPDPAPYRDMVRRLGIDPARAAMFEDSFKNLKPAADLGMVTVWVRHVEHVPGPHDDLSHCRFVTDDMVAWLEEAVSALGATMQPG